MANPPDIVAVAHIYGITETTKLTGGTPTPAQVIMPNPADNYTHKINTILISNIDGTNNCDVTIYIDENTVLTYLAYTITIPADASLSLIDTPLYINHLVTGTGNRLMATAQNPDDLDIVVSYEQITDVA